MFGIDAYELIIFMDLSCNFGFCAKCKKLPNVVGPTTSCLFTVAGFGQALGKLCGGKDDWPGTLALVHSYLTHKAGNLSFMWFCVDSNQSHFELD